ncbi:MarR family winged helix-turn-helix transcriptional regulator [Nonomuraea candida]|uniref:MarR family winged helix-turn-helix transcriptional regulator n=1 Tax=Nonomuraea candida TaxID=359159 RepID=UPI000A887BA3|nr:MarR family transcriptional regulator [Nonomuraea candida]
MTLLRAESLSAGHLEVWRMLQRAQVRITRHLEGELLGAHDLPPASYDVLAHLAGAPGRRLRMNDLAERVLLSRSGLTRLVDRLQRDGLVMREACADDARGLYAVLSDRGADRLAEATPTYLRGVGMFLARLDEEDLARVPALLAKVGDLGSAPEPAEQVDPLAPGRPVPGLSAAP